LVYARTACKRRFAGKQSRRAADVCRNEPARVNQDARQIGGGRAAARDDDYRAAAYGGTIWLSSNQ